MPYDPAEPQPRAGSLWRAGKGALGPETKCTDPELLHSYGLTAVACSFYCFNANNGVFPGKICALKFPLKSQPDSSAISVAGWWGTLQREF